MKKFAPIIFIVLLIAGFVYFKQNQIKPKPAQLGQEEKTQKPPTTKEKGVTGMLQDILKLGASYKCQYQGDQTQITSYIKNKKVYTEVIMNNKKSHTIVVDNCSWAWDGQEKQGVKICQEKSIIQDEQSTKQENKETSREIADDQVFRYQYQCQPAIVSDNLFNPPNSINFIDLNQMQNQFNNQ